MSKWIKFELVDELLKTNVWSIQTIESGLEIGIIKWKPSWRKYSFFPSSDTVFEVDCLMDIVNFINTEMQKRKTKPSEAKGE